MGFEDRLPKQMLTLNITELDRDISVLLYLGKAKREQETFWHMLKEEETQAIEFLKYILEGSLELLSGLELQCLYIVYILCCITTALLTYISFQWSS